MTQKYGIVFSLVMCLAAADAAHGQTAADRGPAFLSGFGAALAVGDGEVLIGEPNNTMRPGAVYVFVKGTDGWMERARLQAGDALDGDGFGVALALEGGTLVVGAANQNKGRGGLRVQP